MPACQPHRWWCILSATSCSVHTILLQRTESYSGHRATGIWWYADWVTSYWSCRSCHGAIAAWAMHQSHKSNKDHFAEALSWATSCMSSSLLADNQIESFFHWWRCALYCAEKEQPTVANASGCFRDCMQQWVTKWIHCTVQACSL